MGGRALNPFKNGTTPVDGLMNPGVVRRKRRELHGQSLRKGISIQESASNRIVASYRERLKYLVDLTTTVFK